MQPPFFTTTSCACSCLMEKLFIAIFWYFVIIILYCKTIHAFYIVYILLYNTILNWFSLTLQLQLTLVISNAMGPWKKFKSTVVRLKRSYENTGSVVCLTTKGRQLERNFEELKPASHVPILGKILNIFDVFVAVFFSLLNSLNLVERLITSRYLFLCVWICLSVLFVFQLLHCH